MGSQSSKVASKAVGAAGRRQYPSTSSILNSATSTSPAPSTSPSPSPSVASTAQSLPPSSVHPSPHNSPASPTKSQHIDLDARDPHFGTALRQAGIARRVPQHTSSSSPSNSFPTSSVPPASQQTPGQTIFPSTSAATNPAIAIVNARERWAAQYAEDAENVGRAGYEGRRLLNMRELKEVLKVRGEGGVDLRRLEEGMKLRRGVLDKLGKEGVVMNT